MQGGVLSEQPCEAPHAVLTPNGEQTIKDGYYCLSYNRKWEPVGNDPAEAVRLLMKKRGELLTVANGGSVVQEPEGEPKVALGRKNFLFCGSDSGGDRAALIYSLLGTAKFNGLDPELYLRCLLEQIPDYPTNRIHDLLPWNLTASQRDLA